MAEIVLRSDDPRSLAIGIDLDEYPDFDPYDEANVSALEEEIRSYLEATYG